MIAFIFKTLIIQIFLCQFAFIYQNFIFIVLDRLTLALHRLHAKNSNLNPPENALYKYPLSNEMT